LIIDKEITSLMKMEKILLTAIVMRRKVIWIAVESLHLLSRGKVLIREPILRRHWIL
jgi:hypothetical protein